MIADTISHLERYLGLHPNLDTAIGYIRKTELNALPEGRNEIDGDRVFVNVICTDSAPAEGREYEYHKHYLDLHLDLSGIEGIAVSLSQPKDLGRFDAQSDGGPCGADGPLQFVTLGKNDFAMAFPWEPHLPLISVGQTERVHKCIFKVLLE